MLFSHCGAKKKVSYKLQMSVSNVTPCVHACVHVEGVGTHTTEPEWIPLENAEYLGDTAGFHFTPSTESG